jgi:hypothetical protein
MLENDVKKEKYSNVLLHEPGASISNTPQIVKKKTYISNVIFYFLIIFIIYFSFFINFLMTRNSFSKNNYIAIKPEIICNKYSINFNKCLEDNKENKEKCNNEGKELEGCYDNLMYFNKRCQAYLSEYDLCIREKKTCPIVKSDLFQCIKKYKYFNYQDIINQFN